MLPKASSALIVVWALGCTDPVVPPVDCTSGRSHCVAEVSLGAHFGCSALLDGTVWCWGRNDESQLGYATTDLCPEALAGGQTRSIACHTFPFQVVGLDHVVQVVSGGAFSCALRDDGTVRCWGSNTAGQLGNGLTLPSATPVAVRGLSGVTALAAGARHVCAVSNGGVFCWGANDRGQLGQTDSPQRCTLPDGEIPCQPQPALLAAIDGVTAVTAGDAHTCARTGEGLAVCWGDARYGQLGTGAASVAPQPVPQAVLAAGLPLTAIHDLTAGPTHTCARTEDSVVWCWGRDDHRELGAPASAMIPAHCVGPCAVQPTVVPGLQSHPLPDAGSDADPVVDALPVGGDAPDAEAGAATDASTDASTDATTDATMDASTDASTDALADGAGDGPAISVDAVAAPPMAPRGVAAGGAFTCAALEDGTARCWGTDTDGQLGDGRRTVEPQGPVLVIATPGAAVTNPLQNVARVAAGGATGCALLTDHSLRCWGSNEAGALGNGNTSPVSGPVPVTW